MTVDVESLQASAREMLPEPVYRYYVQGAAGGVSADEAASAWRRLRLVPRVLTDVSRIDTSASVLGVPLRTPIAIAPTSLQQHAHPRGELAMAAGAHAAGSLICVSSNSGQRYADIAAVGAPWWAQVYVLHDRGLTATMVQRAVSAGAGALVLTVDTPVVATKREGKPSVWEVTPEDYLHGNHPPGGSPAGFAKAADLTPAAIGWLRDLSGLPVVVKGVLRPDDALRAVEAGASAVWVSNHGGRQLDRAVTTCLALPAVAAVASGKAEVYVDGGLRDGTDVLAALALGANAVFLGRPPLWALTAGGAEGVADLVGAMSTELVEAMRLCGTPDLASLDASLVVTPP